MRHFNVDYSVYKKKLYLRDPNYLQAIVLTWQCWQLQINDPQKTKGFVHIGN